MFWIIQFYMFAIERQISVRLNLNRLVQVQPNTWPLLSCVRYQHSEQCAQVMPRSIDELGFFYNPPKNRANHRLSCRFPLARPFSLIAKQKFIFYKLKFQTDVKINH